ncbi:Lrp/AsnC family transcriptional regulator [Paractinoplanes atraurantiacus]|uniref:DNA-binding transcriptional regulator, Lrp family n=1 Tax=Paractinoplanes atraurantiacus TaxID=1036182 RepID=A0A285KKK0_9ACTN|nr:Lrp/AsnC family transcriptional regulator [Actinoplanes atraurantiacus]SNY71801.1 DNA-binding transcriptional regulator, Lrp family [Actinoplanes atraurantiacus]
MTDQPKDLRGLDHIDRELLALLEADGRMPNNALAERVGIAPSTCLTRVRRLREIGAIRGFHADVDPAWIGRPIEAMIAVKIRSESRDAIGKFASSLADIPAVRDVYFVSGSYDFLLHVATADVEDLRAVITERLSGTRLIAGTETYLIFEHRRGQG